MSKVCVYMVNEHPLYMNMACHSIEMLRQHSNVPVKLFLINDSAKSTFSTDRTYPGLDLDLTPDQISEITVAFTTRMMKLGVDVRLRTPHQLERTYIHANQGYMGTECPEDLVLFIDADTFIFGNVETVMDGYRDYDVVGLEADWIKKEPLWKAEWFDNATPMTTCLMLFRNGQAVHWGNFLLAMCQEYAETDTPISNWIRNKKIIHLREELSLTPFVLRNTLRWRLFEANHCCQINVADFWKNTIVHAFAYNWLKAYEMLTGKKELPLAGVIS